MQDYTIHELKGEEVINYLGSLWQYVSLHFKNGSKKHVYFHVSCDSITDDNAHCILCCKPSPCATN
jgi:hypothetical protein